MENKTAGIITAIIIFIASIAGLYNLNSAQQEHVQQLELQIQQLEQRSQTAGAAFPVPIPGYYIAAGENGVTGSKIANNSITDMRLDANAIVLNYTTNATAGVSSATLTNISTPGSLVLNRTTSAVIISYSAQVRTTDSYGGAFMRLIIDNVEQSPGVVSMGNGSLLNNSVTSYIWYNSTLGQGTHWYNIQGNVTSGTVTTVNSTLIAEAFPK